MARCPFLLILPVLSCALLSLALPILRPRQDAVTALNANAINTFTPFTHFASAAYCPANETGVWQCGGTRYSGKRHSRLTTCQITQLIAKPRPTLTLSQQALEVMGQASSFVSHS